MPYMTEYDVQKGIRRTAAIPNIGVRQQLYDKAIGAGITSGAAKELTEKGAALRLYRQKKELKRERKGTKLAKKLGKYGLIGGIAGVGLAGYASYEQLQESNREWVRQQMHMESQRKYFKKLMGIISGGPGQLQDIYDRYEPQPVLTLPPLPFETQERLPTEQPSPALRRE